MSNSKMSNWAQDDDEPLQETQTIEQKKKEYEEKKKEEEKKEERIPEKKNYQNFQESRDTRETRRYDDDSYGEKKYRTQRSYDDDSYQERRYRTQRSYDNKPIEVDPSKFPDEPPYTAYIGNLSFDIQKEDVEDFFKDLNVVRVSLPFDHERNKLKGHGYVEFEKLEGLKAAIKKGGQLLLSRNIRIDVTERRNRPQRRNRDEDDDYSKNRFAKDSEADNVNSWRGMKKKVKKKPDYDSYERRDYSNNKYSSYSKNRDYDREKNSSYSKNRDYGREKKKKVLKENPFGDSKPWEPNEYANKVWERKEKERKELEERTVKSTSKSTGRFPRNDYSRNKQPYRRKEEEKEVVKKSNGKKTDKSNKFSVLQE